MRKLFYCFLVLVMGLLFYQLFQLSKQKKEVDIGLATTQQKLALILEENKKLQADIEYYKNPENLVKELKARFDYKREGEKLLIVVPKTN